MTKQDRVLWQMLIKPNEGPPCSLFDNPIVKNDKAWKWICAEGRFERALIYLRRRSMLLKSQGMPGITGTLALVELADILEL